MDTQKFEQELAALNGLITQLFPLVGGGIVAVKMMVALFKKNKIDLGPFQAEIDKMLAAENAGQALIDEFRARHAPVPEASATPPDGLDLD